MQAAGPPGRLPGPLGDKLPDGRLRCTFACIEARDRPTSTVPMRLPMYITGAAAMRESAPPGQGALIAAEIQGPSAQARTEGSAQIRIGAPQGQVPMALPVFPPIQLFPGCG